MVLSPTTSPNQLFFWRCDMCEVLCEFGTYLCVVFTLPECLRCLSSVRSLPPCGTLAAQRDTNMLLRTNQESVVFQGNPELYFPYDTP